MKEHISGKLLRLWSIKTIRTVSKFVWQLGRYEASSPSTKELNGHTMELFSRNRWTTGSAQESIGYVKLQSICHNHNSIPLGPIEPSSSSAKELHGHTIPSRAKTILHWASQISRKLFTGLLHQRRRFQKHYLKGSIYCGAFKSGGELNAMRKRSLKTRVWMGLKTDHYGVISTSSLERCVYNDFIYF